MPGVASRVMKLLTQSRRERRKKVDECMTCEISATLREIFFIQHIFS